MESEWTQTLLDYSELSQKVELGIHKNFNANNLKMAIHFNEIETLHKLKI